MIGVSFLLSRSPQPCVFNDPSVHLTDEWKRVEGACENVNHEMDRNSMVSSPPLCGHAPKAHCSREGFLCFKSYLFAVVEASAGAVA